MSDTRRCDDDEEDGNKVVLGGGREGDFRSGEPVELEMIEMRSFLSMR